MTEWSDVLKSFTEASDSLVRTGLYPPGFDQQDPASQLTWLDQLIPQFEQRLAILEMEVPYLRAICEAPAPQDFDFLSPAGEESLRARKNAGMKLVAISRIREQLTILKAHRAAIAALVPPSAHKS